MKIETLHIGMRIRHPGYGLGTIKTISEHSADIQFDDGRRTVDPETGNIEPAETRVTVSGLETPLAQFIEQVVVSTIQELGLEKAESVIDRLGVRWNGGRMVLYPSDPTLQSKEVPLEAFFHKIVMMRNNFRVLEQKINANDKFTDAEKVDFQQYITRCYGSMTTFNLLFRNKEDQFDSRA